MPHSIKALLTLLAIGALQVTASQTTTCKTSKSTSSTTTKAKPTTSSKCGTDNCLQVVSWFPWLGGEVSSFCSSYIHAPAPATSTSTSIVSKTVTVSGPSKTNTVQQTDSFTATSSPSRTTLSVTATVTTISSFTSVCQTTVTVTGSLTTSTVSYVARNNNPADKRDLGYDMVKRDAAYIEGLCNDGCDSHKTPYSARLSSACSCYLGKPTTAHTVVTSTVTATTVLSGATTAVTSATSTTTTLPGGTVTSTASETVTISGATTVCGSSTNTVTNTVFAAGMFTCGNTFTATPTAAESGSITCSPAVPTPSLNGLFRIEGLQSGEGTIFEGCILSGPRNITTPSGGTHECDGTNDGANPSPGTTPTDQIDAAGRQDSFRFDGTYESQYQDYFITTISETTQGGDDYWGVLVDLVYTPTGGCQSEVNPGDSSQWIFNAFNYNTFLSVTPAYAVVEVGSSPVAVTVQGTDGNENSNNPVSGASIGGQTSGSDGLVELVVPTQPGCYQYKALKSGAAPSNAFYLTVLPAGSFT